VCVSWFLLTERECVCQRVFTCRESALALVQVGRETGTGTESERIKLKLTLDVESTDFDAEGMHVCLLAYYDCECALCFWTMRLWTKCLKDIEVGVL